MAADSFTHNKITMIKGPAGSGKSYLALGFLFNQLEKHYNYIRENGKDMPDIDKLK